MRHHCLKIILFFQALLSEKLTKWLEDVFLVEIVSFLVDFRSFLVLVVKRLVQFSRSQHQFFANFYLNGGGTTRGIKGILLKIAEKVQGSGSGALGKCS